MLLSNMAICSTLITTLEQHDSRNASNTMVHHNQVMNENLWFSLAKSHGSALSSLPFHKYRGYFYIRKRIRCFFFVQEDERLFFLQTPREYIRYPKIEFK